jgi:hypothetical protein
VKSSEIEVYTLGCTMRAESRLGLGLGLGNFLG